MTYAPIHRVAALLLTLAAPMALAAQPPQSAPTPASSRPVTANDPNAQDVATTPLRDLNISKRKIPAVLIAASEQPYSLAGLNSCRRLANAVGELNTALGDDIDVAHAKGHTYTAGYIAQTVVDSFIPFGGIVSEVSGANAHKREIQAAVTAGFARRGFLKGVGLSRRCPAPARPA